MVDSKRKRNARQPDSHRRQTEWRLVGGGFLLILVIGGPIMWLLWGPTIASVAIGVMVLAAIIFSVLLLLLRAMERWAKSE